jgi:hypothetical protein
MPWTDRSAGSEPSTGLLKSPGAACVPMRASSVLPLLLVPLLLAAGCATPGGGPTPTTPGSPTAATGEAHPAQAEIYNKTLDFSADPSGAAQEAKLDFPAWTNLFTLSGTWRGSAPVATTSQVRVEIHDKDGTLVAGCSLDTNVVTQPSSCGPKSNNVKAERAPYKLVWSGFGDVQLDVRVTAQAAQE